MDLYGIALRDYYNGNHSSSMILHRDDGYKAELPAKVFFAELPEFTRIEKLALDLCFGEVLDIGAGTGRHTLELQKRGKKCLALDISAEAVEIMRRKGVERAECTDIFDFNGTRSDTLIMLLHGIGMVETISGLGKFLNHAHNLIKPGGCLIFDSMDVRCTEDPGNLSYQESNKTKNRYFGEIHLQFEYKGKMGRPWIWLHVDPEKLEEEALKAGWKCEILIKEQWGDYLARLTELI
jgi:SAM-dependent methyltransferase